MLDREKVIKGLERCESYGQCNDESCPYYREVACLEKLRQDALTLLKEQEAKHGKWLESKILEDCLWVCSECEFPSEAFAAPMIYKYCPNCGVKMDRR